MTHPFAAILALGGLALSGVSCTPTTTGTSSINQVSTAANAMNSTSTVLGQVFGAQQQAGAAASTYSPGSYQTDGYDQGNMDYVDVTPLEPTSSTSSSSSYTPSPSQVYTPPSAPPPASTSNGGAVHTVQKGDTLWSISRRHNTSVAAIQAANNMSGTDIHPGDLLTIR